MSTSPKGSHNVANLIDLPTEILDTIILEVLGIQDPICVSIEVGWPVEEPVFEWRLPDVMLTHLNHLIKTSRTLRDHAQQCLARHASFLCDSWKLEHFPLLFGSENAEFIRRFDMSLSIQERIAHEESWPDLLRVLVKDLPELVEFKLSTTWVGTSTRLYSDDASDSTESSTREAHEIARLLRFGAFLTLRHPRLQRLIWPGDNNSMMKDIEGRSLAFLIMDQGMINQPGDLRRRWKQVNRDEVENHGLTRSEHLVLNATAIRRTKLRDLTRTPIDRFVIVPTLNESKDDIVTSEIPEATRAYRLVDKRGYSTKNERDRRGWGYQTVDELIDFCNEVGSKRWKPEGLVRLLANERGNNKKDRDELRDVKNRLAIVDNLLRSALDAEHSRQIQLKDAEDKKEYAEQWARSAQEDMDLLNYQIEEELNRANNEHARAEAGWARFKVLATRIGLGRAILATSEGPRPTFMSLERGFLVNT